jgi:hypothetical protein
MVLLSQSLNPLPDVGIINIFMATTNKNGSVTYLVEVDEMAFYVRKKANYMWVDSELAIISEQIVDFIGNLIDKIMR